jgi:hypothetical protein
MSPQIVQPARPQRAENDSLSANNKYKFTSPAIVPDVVNEFRKNRHAIPLPRTVAMNQKIHSGAVIPALIHFLFERTQRMEANQQRLERMIDRALTVREMQGLRRVA